jgi:Lrp/AsnC family leucine-responsive transcriptional regulator
MNPLEMRIDLKDRKILAELDFNARIKNSELAKKASLSKKSIEYRIKKLESSGLIIGYRPIINFMNLDYYYCRVFFKLQYLTREIKETIEKYINGQSYANWAIWFRGEYDLGLGIWAKTLSEFKEVLSKFNVRFSKYIKEKRTSILIELGHYPHRFIFDSQKGKEIVMKKEDGIQKLDLFDKKILVELTKNARKSSTEIAEKIGSNYKTVSYRIKKLIENKILIGTRAIIDERLLEYTVYKVFLSIKKRDVLDTERIKDYFKNYLGAAYIIDEISMADLELEVVCRSNKEFFEFLDDLQEKFPDLIMDYEYGIIAEIIGVNFLPKDLLNS